MIPHSPPRPASSPRKRPASSSSSHRNNLQQHNSVSSTPSSTTTVKAAISSTGVTTRPTLAQLAISVTSASIASPPASQQHNYSPQPPLSPHSSSARKRLDDQPPVISTTAIHPSPYGGGSSSRPQSARSQGGQSYNGTRCGSRPNSGAARSVCGVTSTASSAGGRSTSNSSNHSSRLSREYCNVDWGAPSRVVTSLEPPRTKSDTILTPAYSYQSKSLTPGQSRIYAKDIPTTTFERSTNNNDDYRKGTRVSITNVSQQHHALTALREQYHEEFRDYDTLESSEKKLRPAYEVPQWMFERAEFARERELSAEAHAALTDDTISLERHRLATWSSVARLHHCLPVACIVAVQLFIRSAIDRRKRLALALSRRTRLHQLPQQLSTIALDEAAREMELRCRHHRATSPSTRIELNESAGTVHNIISSSTAHVLLPHPPSNSKSVSSSSVLTLSDVMESFSSPRQRQLRRLEKQRQREEQQRQQRQQMQQQLQVEGSTEFVSSTSVVIFGGGSNTSLFHGGIATLVPRPPSGVVGSAPQHRELSKASAAYRQRRKSLLAGGGPVDESIIKENAAFTIHHFFKFAAQVFKVRAKRRQLEEYFEDQLVEERVSVIQMFLRCISTHAVIKFKRYLQRRSLAAGVIQRGFRAFRCRLKYLQRLQELNESHDERVALDHLRDACRVLIRALQGMRARSIIRKRQKLLQLKMRYREEAERRQRNQELMDLLSHLLNSIVRRVKKKNAIRLCNAKRIAQECAQEKKIRVAEAVPLLQQFLHARKSGQVRRQKEQALMVVLQGHCREKHLVVYRVTNDAIARALSRRVEIVTTSFLERCPFLWRRKLFLRAREVRLRLQSKQRQVVLTQAFCRTYLDIRNRYVRPHSRGVVGNVNNDEPVVGCDNDSSSDQQQISALRTYRVL
ncbi:Hypothetical protein, putative [Bodo saltans]|uniref:IQ calmodulin-binding protein n=1 Tax=Bodo saltans TaxID=75058 RepID=A0A0S4KLE1_BODSA|nr:Hypothetical protein, putative [Bodo saltans]|eukprot:CUI15303.1 Hypothetical protein, putative [Bodo saltans]